MRPVFILSLLVSACTSGEETAAPVPDLEAADDPSLASPALLANLQDLLDIASANNGNRAVGTQGYLDSVVWAEERFAALGLEPRREPFDVGSWQPTGGSLTVDGTDDLEYGVFEWSAAGSASGDVVGVDLQLPPSDDPNTSTSGCEASDFDGFPAGAVALIQRGSCTFTTKVANAEEAGAAAVLLFNEGQPGRTGVVFGSLDSVSPPGIPVLGLSFADGERLAAGAEVDLSLQTDEQRTETWNVLADIEGQSGMVWVVGAHLDSVPAGPGINDNGTGVSLVLQLAERLSGTKPEHGVRLALWGAEEVGLVGSLSHTRALEQADVDQLLGNLNFDMIGSPNPGRFIYDGDGSAFRPSQDLDPGSATLERLFQEHFDSLDLPYAPTAFGGRTDYVGFADLGLPVGGTFTGAEERKALGDADLWGGEPGVAFDPCYHRQCDAVDNVDLETHEEQAIAAATVLERLISGEEDAARRIHRGVARHDLPVRIGRGCAGQHEPLILE